MGRLLRVALAGIALALVLAAAGQTFPSDLGVSHQIQRNFLADCTGGLACADLEVAVKDSPDPVPAGDRIDYFVTLDNRGPNPAPVAVVTVELPKEGIVGPSGSGPLPLTYTASSGDHTVCTVDSSTSTVTCRFADVGNTIDGTDPFGTREVDISFAADPHWFPGESGPPVYPRPINVHASVPDSGTGYADPFTTNNGADANTGVLSPGDLSLAKSHTDPLFVSNSVEYDLKLTNIAQAATLPERSLPGSPPWAVDNPITVTDRLPEGFVLDIRRTEANDPATRCEPDNANPGLLESQTVTCRPAVSIEPGAANAYTLKLFVRPRATGWFVNNAQVSQYGDKPSDPTPADNTSSDPTKVGCPPVGTSNETVPLLCTTKNDGDPLLSAPRGATDLDASIYQGKPFTYTIRVTNTHATDDIASDPANPVVVRDTLPPGMSVAGASVGGGGSCSSSAGVLTCRLTPPDFNHATTRTITVSAIEQNTGTFENLVCTSIGDGGPDSCAIERTTVHAAGDLAITKTASATTVNVFGQVTYTLTATNNGPAAMPNAVVTDDIQAHLELVSVNPSGPTCGFTGTTDAGGTVSCNLGTIAKGQTKTISIVVSPQQQGTYSNLAKIVPDSTPGGPIDIDLTNNTSATVTFLANAADVSIAKTASPDVVGVGQTLTYTIVVTNNGPGDASGVTVKDPLPTVLSFATVTTTTGTCTGTQNITCNIGSLANGATAAITIRATPTAPGTVSNTASVTSTSSDLNDANNSASVSNRVIAADLSITKVASPSPVAIGIPITYTIKVKNLGPDAATGVTVIDSLPSQVTLATPTPSQGTCFGSITCAVGNLAVGATATITITATPFVPDVTITNTATVSSSFDLNPANNTASASTRVRQPVLDVTPDIGPLGFVPFATGKNFPPNSTVLLRWNRGLGRRAVVTNSDGAFRVPMLIFTHDLTGVRGLVATPSDPNTPAVAFVPPTAVSFRVVSSTSQPFRTKPHSPSTVIIQRGG